MAESDDAQTQLRRQFEAVIAGLDGTELHDLGRRLLDTPAPSARPDLRRAPLPQPATLRIRVDLDGAQPPIWRRLDLHGDLTLDVVHQVLQAAFDWTDSHLHRFSLGNHPFHPAAALFLCPFDVQEGEDDGVPAADVRLDETLQEPGDRLHYLYDYGDSWELTLELEEVRPRSDTAATAIGGARTAPPVELRDLLDLPVVIAMDSIDEHIRRPSWTSHPLASALARAALQR